MKFSWHLIVSNNVSRTQNVLEIIGCKNYLLKTVGFTSEVHLSEKGDIDKMRDYVHRGRVTYTGLVENNAVLIFKGLREVK
jgi:hypothetical protein